MVSENPYSWAFLAKSCKRREFIKVTAGAAVSWPLVAHAQQRMPRIGVIMNQSPSDGETQTRSKAFLQELQKLGWVERTERSDRISVGCEHCRGRT